MTHSPERLVQALLCRACPALPSLCCSALPTPEASVAYRHMHHGSSANLAHMFMHVCTYVYVQFLVYMYANIYMYEEFLSPIVQDTSMQQRSSACLIHMLFDVQTTPQESCTTTLCCLQPLRRSMPSSRKPPGLWYAWRAVSLTLPPCDL